MFETFGSIVPNTDTRGISFNICSYLWILSRIGGEHTQTVNFNLDRFKLQTFMNISSCISKWIFLIKE